jgi:anti-anti-sigma factor
VDADGQPEGPPVEVSADRLGDVAIVRVAGELDLAGVGLVREALDGVRRPVGCVVLDLADLEFIDSVGLTLAVRERARASVEGHDFVVAGASPAILRVFELAGVAEHVRFAPDARAVL